MAAARTTTFAIVTLAFAAAAQAAQPPCPPGDKPCAAKAVQAHPAKHSPFWREGLSRPLAERIQVGPPELVEFLVLDVVANGFPNKPRASNPDAAFLADVRRAFDGIPAPIKKLLEPKLAGIYFVDDIGGTGFTDTTS